MKPFQREAAQKLVTADRDHVAPFGLMLLVVECFLREAVDGKNDKLRRRAVKLCVNLRPPHSKPVLY